MIKNPFFKNKGPISLKNIQTKFKYERFGNLVNPFYLEAWDDKVIFGFKDGSFYSIPTKT